VVVRYLGEEVVDDMSADVMVDVVDPPVVSVHGRQATTEVAPFLAAVPREILVAMVVKIRHQIKPHHKHNIWNPVDLEHWYQSEHARHADEQRNHREPAGGGDDHVLPLLGGKQTAARVEVRASLARASVPEVDRESQEREWY